MRTEIPKLVKEAPSVMPKGPSLVTLVLILGPPVLVLVLVLDDIVLATRLVCITQTINKVNYRKLTCLERSISVC